MGNQRLDHLLSKETILPRAKARRRKGENAPHRTSGCFLDNRKMGIQGTRQRRAASFWYNTYSYDRYAYENLRFRRLFRKGDTSASSEDHSRQAHCDDARGQAPRPHDCRCSGGWHGGVGDRSRGYTFHSLVPAAYRRNRRKAQRLPRARRPCPGGIALFRQKPHRRRGGRVVVPVRRPSLNFRGAWLHGVGSYEPCLHKAPFQRRG